MRQARVECKEMLTAITRAVSPSMEACELSYLERQPIDIARARGAARGLRGVPARTWACT